MRTSTPMAPGSWARQPLGTLWKMRQLAGDYFAPPHMELVRASTQFGRLEHRSGPLALLLTVLFHNDSEQAILLESLAIKYGGTWYQPIHFLGDEVHLLYRHGQHSIQSPRAQNIIAAPYISAAAVSERFGLFRLPELWDQWPTSLQVLAKATFVRRRSRSLLVTLTNPA